MEEILSYIHRIDEWLIREEMEVGDGEFFLITHLQSTCDFSFLQVGLEPVIDIFTRFCFLVTGSDLFLIVTDTLVYSFEVGKDEFEIDNLDITLGIDRTTHMVNIRVIESTNDLEDGIDTANMGEEFISESFPLTGSFDEPSNIDEFDGCRDDLRAIHHSTDLLEAFIIHIHDPDIGFDRTEGKVCCFGGIRLRKGIEEGRFTDIRETDDSDLHILYIRN